jgi:RNA 2',3'-cyclic 3'-phosphodiesterase
MDGHILKMGELDLKSMRLFVAVQVPDELKEKAASLSKELPADAITPVRPKNMHLTLRFIGEVDEKAKDEIVQSLGKISFKMFRCTLRGVGVFPSEDYVRVVWAGVESGGALETLAKDVIGALEGYGKDEERKFTAHLTIVRVRRKIDATQFLSMHKEDVFGEFTIPRFELVESILGPTGPEYRLVKAFG